jgi:ribosome silencing factor RsfS/YbeB/iojap
MVRAALDAAIDKGARAPTILRMTELAGYTDWVMILSGRSDRHTEAVALGVQEALAARGRKPRGTDGFDQNLWDLLDYDDFIVHVFFHPVRMHYDLESMWSDAPRVVLPVADDVMDTSDLESLSLPGDLPAWRGDESFGGYEDEFSDEDDEDDGDAAASDNDEGWDDAWNENDEGWDGDEGAPADEPAAGPEAPTPVGAKRS